MSSFLERIANFSPKRLALLAAELQERLERAEGQRGEPVAIVGMGCRMPGGANTPEAFWQLLAEGRDAIQEVPPDRWDAQRLYDPNPDTPGRISTRWGGFVEGIDQFDPDFFGISPREAAGMDPQQRMLLEVAWEALENAGENPSALNGSPTGVFVGVCNSDYYGLMLGHDPASIDAYLATGSAHSVASGRLSYVMGFQGPSLSVDTACSASLVAVHLACQSLKNGECRIALAGGVNAILLPEITMTLSKARLMASDGRCKAFDASADGFVRAEGCGLVVLKRLSQALEDGDHIYAVIRASSLNQDGRSNGLTAPNGPSQESVIRGALKQASLAPDAIDYIESHGTGTSLGDPIEARALANVFGPGRVADHPLWIGSAKTNLGHMESAAGIAGLMKAALALENESIPAHLHFKALNPHIDWGGLAFEVPRKAVAWRRSQRARLAGVSSFGFSGTNAHVILEEAPMPPAPQRKMERPVHVLALSARSPEALRQMAENHAGRLRELDASGLGDAAFTTNTSRALFAHRLALSASTGSQAADALESFARGEQSEAFICGETSAEAPETGFLFTGQGAQYPGMGRDLFETQPIFREALEQCADAFSAHLDRPLFEILFGADHGDASPIHQTQYTQPSLFALEYALCRMWRAWGIEPAAVMGHSVGEYAACCAAGVFSMEDGARLIAERARLMQSLPAGGTMAAVFADEAVAGEVVRSIGGGLAIAAINGPGNTVISGPEESVRKAVGQFATSGIDARLLFVSHAFHSALMEPILEPLEAVARSVEFHAPSIPLISNLTGAPVEAGQIDASYWRDHTRQPVRFAQSIQRLAESGVRILLEIGPHPVLLGMARQCVEGDSLRAWLPSMRRGKDAWGEIASTLEQLHVLGASIDWRAFDAPYARRKMALPAYPFQRKRYWLKGQPKRAAAMPGDGGMDHPLLERRLESPALQGAVFEAALSLDSAPYLRDHRIFERHILPSPAYVEMALAGAEASTGHEAWTIEDLLIREPLVLSEDAPRPMQLVIRDANATEPPFEFYARERDRWISLCAGKFVRTAKAAWHSDGAEEIAAIRERCAQELSGEEFYAQARNLGLEFGPRFQGLQQIWRRDGEALGEVVLPEDLAADAANYRIHPALLDACFHLLGAAAPGFGSTQAWLLIGIDRLAILRKPPGRLWNHTVLEESDSKRGLSGSIRLTDDQGRLVARIEGVHLCQASRANFAPRGESPLKGRGYRIEWPRIEWPGEASVKPAPQSIAAGLEDLKAGLEKRYGLEIYGRLFPQLDVLVGNYILAALKSMGADWQPAFAFSVSEAADALGVIAPQRRLFERLLAMLAEDGYLEAADGRWRVARPMAQLEAADPQALLERYPDCAAEITLTRRCGEHLAEVLRGEADPLQILFPGGDFSATEALYRDAPYARAFNELVREALKRYLDGLPQDRPVRCLEIGAGTGATTSAVIDLFAGRRAQYVFSDVSPAFLARAKEAFADYSFIDYALLDMQEKPAEQGFGREPFDIILAANVIHATRDLRASIHNMRGLLKSGGAILLLEGILPARWVDITFGMTAGWWGFEDADLRPAHPLLTGAQWIRLLNECGLEAAGTFDDSGRAIATQQSVFMAAAPPPSSQARPECILALTDDHVMAEALGEELGARFERQSVEVLPMEAPGLGALRRSIGAALDRSPDCTVVLVAMGLQGVATETEARESGPCLAQMALVQELAAARRARPPKVWVATCGAQPVGEHPVTQPLGAMQWGMGRVISLELPELWGGLIDLDPALAPNAQPGALAQLVASLTDEDELALRGGQLHAARLMRFEPTAATRPSATMHGGGCYLVTGGLGGLGLHVAHHLAQRGAGEILLLTRRDFPHRDSWDAIADDAVRPLIERMRAMEALGATVRVVRGDVGEIDSLRACLRKAQLPLRGVIHAAVEMSVSPVLEMDERLFWSMLRTKVDGAWNLHQLAKTCELDFFVLFSSTTALWGVAGLGHYAAANQCMDAFAHWRNAQGLPATSINWGTWEEMRVASAAEQATFAQSGLHPLSLEDGLAAMEWLLQSATPQATVAEVDWPVLAAVYQARRKRPLLAEIEISPVESKRKEPEIPARPKDTDFRTLPPAQRRSRLAEAVRREVSIILGMDSAMDVDEQRGLFEMGMDSLMAVDLRGRLERLAKMSLPATLTFNYPTVQALVDFLAGKMDGQARAQSAAKAVEAPVRERADMSEDDLAALLSQKLENLK